VTHRSFRFALTVAFFSSFLGVSTTSADSARAPHLKPKVTPPTGLVDPLIKKDWSHEALQLSQVWQLSKGSPESVIAFVDSGIDYNHPEIAFNVRWKAAETTVNHRDDDDNGFADDVIGWNFDTDHRMPWDLSGHGTFLSVIAAGIEGNGIGSAGICPRCSILPVRFMDEDGLGDTEDAIQAIRYAVDEGAKVINFLEKGNDVEAGMAATRATIATRGALQSSPDEPIVKGAVKITEALQLIVQAYRTAATGKYDDVIDKCKQAWDLGAAAEEFSPTLKIQAQQVQMISGSLADQARALKK
jgi:hypothetical protein